MTSIVEDFEVNLTPSKKRKATKNNNNFNGAFVNPGLNVQEPIKTQQRYVYNKENIGFNPDAFMEVKSIAELAAENPYEVIRKPPKKKTKCEIEESCFTNPALNLDVVEREPINPFELKRIPITVEPTDTNCFVNPCLSIRGPDKRTNFNPFEIVREKEPSGVENDGLQVVQQQTLAIGLPFTPTVGRRINFNDVAIESLTPSELLAKTLVFSPLDRKETPRRNLSVISEEAVDIAEELDCYQLELENSINEAKTRKGTTVRHQSTRLSLKFTLPENIDEEEEEKEETVEVTKDETKNEKNNETETNVQTETADVEFEEIDDSRNDDDEAEEDDFDFKAPAPFTRTFRRSVRVNPNQIKTTDAKEQHDLKFKDKVRRSFRKLMKPKINDNGTADRDHLTSPGIISSIRRSFRRKPKSNDQAEEQTGTSLNDISIVNTELKRTVYRQTVEQFDFDRNNGAKTFRSSLRRTTKGIQRQMKSVLKTNADYKL